MKIYNSLTKRKEELKTVNENTVKMYSCGPTVYYYPHIGNMRAYIFMDSLRRVLKYNGYNVEGVMNITDVGHLTSDSDSGDDKMEKAAKRENKTPQEIAEYYTNIFFDNFKKLNIDTPEHITKATEYIDKMIDFIKILEEKGYTYLLDDGLYFDVSKFKDYGSLSGKSLDDELVGRIEENQNKHHPFDFALWKFVEPNHIMKWDSPWGVGCPGWHIECSAMCKDILGEYVDIHTGGIDHKTIHHENEIAQNNCAFEHQVVNNWMHCEFLLVDNGKMSKSLNNIYTIDDLINRGYSPLDFKYFCLNTHYRKNINFTFEGLTSAQLSLNNLGKLLLKHKDSNYTNEDLSKYKQEFIDAVNDDLNIPLALGTLWTMLKSNASKEKYDLALEFDKVLGLKLDEFEITITDIPEEIVLLAKERWEAKQNKEWDKADSLRNKVFDLGYIINDKKDEYKIVPK